MKLSAEEITTGKLNPDSLESAVRQVKLNGYVLFEKVLPEDLIDTMNDEFLRVLDFNMKNNPDSTELNTREFRKNRVRMDLPFYLPFTDPRVITNSFALPVIEKLLGDDCRCFYLSVDAPMPGSDYQVVHGDYRPFYPESDMILPITGLVVNIPLIDVTEENGPMEAWPGTHFTPECNMGKEDVAAAAKHVKPHRMLMPKGSVLVRDIRMWHRGTPNNSQQIRPNVAMIYGRQWWDGAFYAQQTLGITREKFEMLSERAQKLFRFETLID